MKGKSRIMMDRLTDFLARRHVALTWAILLGSLLSACLLPRLTINNSIEVWLRQGSPEYQRYQAFTSRYGSEEFVVIALETPDALAPEAMALQKTLAGEIGKIEGVEDILSLAQFEELIRRGDDGEYRINDGGFLRHLLLSEDHKTVGLVVWLGNLAGPSARRTTVESIERVADTVAGPGRAHLAGTPLMNVALDRSSQRASLIFLPLALAVSVGVLLFMLRSFRGMLAVVAAVGATVAWTMGLVALVGRPLNMVTVTIPSLMFALALSNGIHLASEFTDNMAALGERQAALRKTFRDLLLPAFLTAITTAIGFSSLAISNMDPVTDLGLFSAAGILIGFVCTLVAVPGLLAIITPHPRTHPRNKTAHWTEYTGNFCARHPRALAGLSLALVVVFAFAAQRIRTESNVLKFFPADSRVARDYAFVGTRLTGFYTVEIDAFAPAGTELAVTPAMERLTRVIESRPEVARADHLGRVEAFGQASLAGGLKITPASTLQFMKLRLRFTQPGEGGRWLRLSVLVRAMNSTEFYALLDFIKREAQRELPETARFEITGIVPLLNDAQEALVRTQVNTFLLAGLVIMAVIGLLFRSWRVMLVVIPPNLTPIMGTFALMGVAGIPLDAATVMIASIAIGISVDDAIHFLSRYRHTLRQTGSVPEAAQAAYARMGRAAVFTSVVAAAGFSVLALARFRPLAEFGILTGFTMITSLAGDLFLLPASAALLGIWKKDRK